MKEPDVPDLPFDDIKNPLVYADREHVIRYLNAAGREHYARFGDLIGKSLFDCHNDASKKAILAYFRRLENGEDEIRYHETPEKRVSIRSVRAPDGYLVGYCEVQEPKPGP